MTERTHSLVLRASEHRKEAHTSFDWLYGIQPVDPACLVYADETEKERAGLFAGVQVNAGVATQIFQFNKLTDETTGDEYIVPEIIVRGFVTELHSMVFQPMPLEHGQALYEAVVAALTAPMVLPEPTDGDTRPASPTELKIYAFMDAYHAYQVELRNKAEQAANDGAAGIVHDGAIVVAPEGSELTEATASNETEGVETIDDDDAETPEAPVASQDQPVTSAPEVQ